MLDIRLEDNNRTAEEYFETGIRDLVRLLLDIKNLEYGKVEELSRNLALFRKLYNQTQLGKNSLMFCFQMDMIHPSRFEEVFKMMIDLEGFAESVAEKELTCPHCIGSFLAHVFTFLFYDEVEDISRDICEMEQMVFDD